MKTKLVPHDIHLSHSSPRLERQRRSATQPRVGAKRLPWVSHQNDRPVAAVCDRRAYVDWIEKRRRSQTAATTKTAFADISFRVDEVFHRLPRVASQTRQPWAGLRNAVGVLFARAAIVLFLITFVSTGCAQIPTLKDDYKDHFLVGAAINRSHAMVSEGWANGIRRNRELVQQEIALVKIQFDQITSENDMKWQSIHPSEGAAGYDFGPADAFVNFGLSNNMYLVGHTLVWHEQTPRWVFENGKGGAADRDTLLARMSNHIHTVVGCYKGKVKVWDVVNEAVAEKGTNVLRDSPWLKIIGPDFIAKAFEFAHQADPDAILRYNDYSLENPSKRRKCIALIKELQAQKIPVHAIGSQTHVNTTSPSFASMDQTLTDLEQLGLPIHITELDVNSARAGQRDTTGDVASNSSKTRGGLIEDADNRSAEQYANLFKAFLKHQNSVKVVTFWGVNDAVSWRANGRPLLFDGDNKPKRAFDAVIKVAGEKNVQ